MVAPTMLLVMIVTSLVQHRVITANIIAPPQIATTISRSPNSWFGRETTQKAIVTEATMAPANALTSAEAMGCVEPRTDPISPAATAMADNENEMDLNWIPIGNSVFLPESVGLPNWTISCFCIHRVHPEPAARPLRNPITRKNL